MGDQLNYGTVQLLANIHAAVEQTMAKLGSEEFKPLDADKQQAYITARLQAGIAAYNAKG